MLLIDDDVVSDTIEGPGAVLSVLMRCCVVLGGGGDDELRGRVLESRKSLEIVATKRVGFVVRPHPDQPEERVKKRWGRIGARVVL